MVSAGSVRKNAAEPWHLQREESDIEPLVIASAIIYIASANSVIHSGGAMAQDSNRPERPRLEPEIIPPARGRREPGWQYDVWQPYASSTGGMHRLYVTRLGPIGLAVLMMLIGIVVAVLVLAVVGAILIWIPILALLLAAGVIFRFWRR
jgi:hypothetical protein